MGRDWELAEVPLLKPFLAGTGPETHSRGNEQNLEGLAPRETWAGGPTNRLAMPVLLRHNSYEAQVEETSKEDDLARIANLESAVRDHVLKRRVRTDLQSEAVRWNKLVAGLDLLADTVMALQAYMATPGTDEGERYLRVYGAFEALFIQQDACSEVCDALGVSITPPAKDPVLRLVREARHDIAGHPTLRWDETSIQLARHSLSEAKLHLMKSASDGSTRTEAIDVHQMIQSQAFRIAELMHGCRCELERREREHKNQFGDRTLRELLPKNADYLLQLVPEALELRDSPRRVWSTIAVNELCAALRALKDELQDRGELFKGSGAAETVRETEYALGQIESYVMGNESVIVDESSGQVFAESLRLRWNDLVRLVDELDADYRADSADQSPEP